MYDLINNSYLPLLYHTHPSMVYDTLLIGTNKESTHSLTSKINGLVNGSSISVEIRDAICCYRRRRYYVAGAGGGAGSASSIGAYLHEAIS